MSATTLPLTAEDFRAAVDALKDKRSRLVRALATMKREKGRGDARTREANKLAIEEAEGTIEDLEDVIANFEAALEAMG